MKQIHKYTLLLYKYSFDQQGDVLELQNSQVQIKGVGRITVTLIHEYSVLSAQSSSFSTHSFENKFSSQSAQPRTGSGDGRSKVNATVQLNVRVNVSRVDSTFGVRANGTVNFLRTSMHLLSKFSEKIFKSKS